MHEDSIVCGDCREVLSIMPNDSVDLVITSPPYPLKTQRYGSSQKLSWQEWSLWMSAVVHDCCRVSRGFVLVVANNPVVDGECLPAIERLCVACHNMQLSMERTAIWHKNSAPNKRPWFVNDWEPVLAFYKPPRPTTWNWEAIAQPPKFSSGGAFRQRGSNGQRREGGEYPQHKLARPRDVLRVPVGGGHLGSKLAHENEAPFPEKLVEPFVLALTNPGDIVLDPFCGSGTTLAVAERLGRRWIGIDNRESQRELSLRRIEEVRSCAT